MNGVNATKIMNSLRSCRRLSARMRCECAQARAGEWLPPSSCEDEGEWLASMNEWHFIQHDLGDHVARILRTFATEEQ